MSELRNVRTSILVISFLSILYSGAVSDADIASSPSGPFFTSDRYDEKVPGPSEFLGFPLASKPINHSQLKEYFENLAETSPRAKLFQYGETYEGHELLYLLITSRENMSRIETIKGSLAEISDPRMMKRGESAENLIADLPAVVWAGYSVHGDELSSTDAAVGVAYQLCAGEDEETKFLLDNLVILIDPLQNPDGRERFLVQIRQFTGKVPCHDLQSIQHTGIWPWGRGNHYLIDLNRDMFTLVHPETRGKISVCLEWRPQLMIDSHEMGAMDTYLFNPPRAPFNPHWAKDLREWWNIFAADQARAFDKYGWSYYTRDWNEEWFPGYTSSWGGFLGIVGILYEQAGVDGSVVKQKTGQILTFSESVHHHYVSSLANIKTAAENREKLLTSYYGHRNRAVANKENPLGAAFIVDPSQNPRKVNRFVETMMLQGIEVKRAESPFKATGLFNEHGKQSSRDFPEGTYIVDFAQPSRYLAQVLLDYDIRMPNSFLEEQRRYIEKDWGSRMYEISAWSLPLAFGLDSYIAQDRINVKASRVTEIGIPAAGITEKDPDFGYMIDYASDAATYFLAEGFGYGLKMRVARKPLTAGGRNFSRGSILFVEKENPDSLEKVLEDLSAKHGVTVFGINTALATEGPDLGGRDLRLLTEPRIAILTGPPISVSGYGMFWHMLDHDFGLRMASVDISRARQTDLSRYNVLVIPSVWGSSSAIESALGKSGISGIKKWVKDGGTLIAVGEAAAFCADTSVEISRVRLKRQSLEELEEYEYALRLEKSADKVTIDSLRIWEAVEPKEKKPKEDKKEKPSKEDIRRADEFARKFYPEGAIFECSVDTTDWLSYGMDEDLPVMMYTGEAYLSKPPVKTVARLKGKEKIRLSGLAWPEARERWANTAYCTRESNGKGQVILFSGYPDFRSYFYGSKRLFVNAVLLGPGLGARWPGPY
ncbi:MAG: hypothetical protein JSW64_00940 [Candidatus Zixiibacteriota bacterium]|nr:MAG: hypothetical protein JSW64_00940 [candidate division Zixibacteria bacterium]